MTSCVTAQGLFFNSRIWDPLRSTSQRHLCVGRGTEKREQRGGKHSQTESWKKRTHLKMKVTHQQLQNCPQVTWHCYAPWQRLLKTSTDSKQYQGFGERLGHPYGSASAVSDNERRMHMYNFNILEENMSEWNSHLTSHDQSGMAFQCFALLFSVLWWLFDLERV